MAHPVCGPFMCSIHFLVGIFVFEGVIYDTACVWSIYGVDIFAFVFEGVIYDTACLWSIYGVDIFAFVFEGVIYGTACVWSTPLPVDDLAHHGGTDHHSLLQCAPVCYNLAKLCTAWRNLSQCGKMWYSVVECGTICCSVIYASLCVALHCEGGPSHSTGKSLLVVPRSVPKCPTKYHTSNTHFYQV